ncbi:MAG: hypothetical protein A6F71_10145 [Cycloclasticus sp. symbiont of Poecilosclerida sp. M]|nr:MAG: hypothetical protein A6F71_10145 [Cycloclasticus sp. symbiont of Poecilosclerida sp. M]
MPVQDVVYYMKRCADAGLFVPDIADQQDWLYEMVGQESYLKLMLVIQFLTFLGSFFLPCHLMLLQFGVSAFNYAIVKKFTCSIPFIRLYQCCQWSYLCLWLVLLYLSMSHNVFANVVLLSVVTVYGDYKSMVWTKILCAQQLGIERAVNEPKLLSSLHPPDGNFDLMRGTFGKSL